MRVQCRVCGLITEINSGDVLVNEEYVKLKRCQYCGDTNKEILNDKENKKEEDGKSKLC